MKFKKERIMIRKERKEEERAAENIAREAFWDLYRPGCVEHLILYKLHREPCFIPELTFVAVEKGRLTGQAACAWAPLVSPEGEMKRIIAMGPLSVLPSCQRRGIGKELVRAVLHEAEKRKYAAVSVIGQPSYFRRFGFRPAARYGLFYKGHEEDVFPFFMVKVLNPAGEKEIRGIYSDPAAYTVSEREAASFDRTFPKKEKHIYDWQLV